MFNKYIINCWSFIVLLAIFACLTTAIVLQDRSPIHATKISSARKVKAPRLSLPSSQKSYNDDYKAAPGEILAKDSILYTPRPTKKVRRQLWPMMQETINDIANGVALGAKMVKQVIGIRRPNTMKTETELKSMHNKPKRIKNVYLPGTLPLMHSKNVGAPKEKPLPPIKIVKSPVIVIHESPGRIRTITEDFIHTYEDGSAVPSYQIKIHKVNPSTGMNVKPYPGYQESLLRALEEKEEKKFEATMQVIDDREKMKNMEIKLLDKFPFDGWKPVRPTGDIKMVSTEKPHPVSKLHTNAVSFDINSDSKPVHEQIEETAIITGENEPESHHSTRTRLTTKAPRQFFPRSVLKSITTKATLVQNSTKPNYPDHYFTKSEHKKNTNNFLSLPSHQHDIVYGSENYQIKPPINVLEDVITAITHRPVRSSKTVASNGSQSYFITPIPTTSRPVLAKMKRVNNRKNKPRNTEIQTIITTNSPKGTAVDNKNGNRGSIKFGDKLIE